MGRVVWLDVHVPLKKHSLLWQLVCGICYSSPGRLQITFFSLLLCLSVTQSGSSEKQMPRQY